MAQRLAHSVSGYRNKLRMTRHSILLVEGPQDRQAFQVLIAEARDAGWQTDRDMVIDTAVSIIAGEEGVTNNREKVERVFEGLDRLPAGTRAAGFVDRDYRGFNLAVLSDEIEGHHQVGQHLVWSRGHSIENYFFDYVIMHHTIRSVAMTEQYDAAIRVLEARFDTLIRLACAIALAGKEHNRLTMLPATIDSDTITFSEFSVDVAEGTWLNRLTRHGCDEGLAQAIIQSHRTWHGALADVPPATIRWLCHGHVGFRVIWAAYGLCIRHSGGDDSEVARTRRAPDLTWFDVSAHAWAQRATTGTVDWPEAVLTILGFSKSIGT
jgi:hypothetical protein